MKGMKGYELTFQEAAAPAKNCAIPFISVKTTKKSEPLNCVTRGFIIKHAPLHEERNPLERIL